MNNFPFGRHAFVKDIRFEKGTASSITDSNRFTFTWISFPKGGRTIETSLERLETHTVGSLQEDMQLLISILISTAWTSTRRPRASIFDTQISFVNEHFKT
jgi:hypothetical protein